MSEYQYVHFMAIDRPLDDKQLDFMQRQSSRAEITRWSFTNEYHYGDFHGNAREMLRRGYDIHLHYANFGIRKLMIRLPAGLPCDQKLFNAYRCEYGIGWNADKKGKGGILEIEPEADAGSYDEDLWDVGELLPAIAPVREQLMGGDLRPLYLAWLACCHDEDSPEPPIPAGLGIPTSAISAMVKLYDVSEDMLSAAAKQSPPMSKSPDAEEMLSKWIAKQSATSLRSLVGNLLGGDVGTTRIETLARIREDMGAATWPLAKSTRTLAQLRELTETLREERLQQEKKAKEASRHKRLATIAAAPDKAIASIEKLVKERSTASYEKAANALSELREALGPEHGPIQATAIAEKLRRQNPRLNLLIRALRKHGLLA